MFFEQLNDRKLLKVSGDDAENFLENIVTCQIAGMEKGIARFGALLTPQGKILFDFFVIRVSSGYLLDVSETIAEELIKRLTFYRLRAKVVIGPSEEETSVFAIWGSTPVENVHGILIADPRLAKMGWRLYSDEPVNAQNNAYLLHRISNAMPEGGSDFVYGDAYPHETLMDQFGGVDFQKGCFVGQEVVSRMQHRGTARKRIIQVHGSSNLPPAGTAISSNGSPVGVLGSVAEQDGLALLRLDRVVAAQAKNTPLVCDGVFIETRLPEWVQFNWPEDK